MKISINDVEYNVPGEEELLLLKTGQAIGIAEYNKLPQQWRILAKPFAREILRTMEEKARKEVGKEQALVFRPGNADPNIHLSNIVLALFQEALKHVTVSIITEHHTIASLSLSVENQSVSGGQVALNGHVREREDHSTEVP